MYKIISLIILILFSSLSFGYTQINEANKYVDFELKIVGSTETIKLSKIVGQRLVLLNFWTTWCPYCVKEIPELKRIYNKYKENGLVVVGVNIGEPETKVLNFIRVNSIPYKVVLDQNGIVARSYGVRGIPTNFIININGEIIFADHFLPNEKFLEENLPKKIQKESKKEKKNESSKK